ncbi:hypothetical protein [Tautonia sociabilis]|uniref:LysM domain-containing protein n=1 Tax=Tautonia sociabilis TaxID=2080755 RepID=A0A432MET0_9BACT|nr:hypothetical protein [Tautonia sociabilis]RUL84187.1 hypothetical protein TsocGM_20905 [Tautonia sociabilis]
MQEPNRPRSRRRRIERAGLGLAVMVMYWLGGQGPSQARETPDGGSSPDLVPAEAEPTASAIPVELPPMIGGQGDALPALPETPGNAGEMASGPRESGPAVAADPAAAPPTGAGVGAGESSWALPEPGSEPGAVAVSAELAVQVDPVQALPEAPPSSTGEPAPGTGLPQPLVSEEEAPTLSLRIEEQDIRRALELIGAQAGVNIIISPAVSGTIDVTLENVTFDRALDIVLRLGGLVARQEDDLIFVYTAEEAEEIQRRERTPIVRVYHLNYVRAIDLFAIVGPFLSEEGTISLTPPSQQGITGAGAAGNFGGAGQTGGLVGAAGGGGLAGTGAGGAAGLAGGGGGFGGGFGGGATGGAGGGTRTGGDSYAVHDMVVVRDYPENVQVIDEIVSRLDVQPMQVLIEAVIISVQLRDGQELGVNFALVDKLATEAIVSGSGAAINLAGGFSPARVLSAAGPPTVPGPLGPYIGDRPSQLMAGYLQDQGLKYGFVSNSVAGFIRALETLNKINILASPRILVLNKQLAEIQLGQRLGYSTTFTNLTTASQQVQFIPVGTLLALRPFVSQDGMIRLEVHPERSSGTIDSAGIPQLSTSELTTNIMVPDGATIVIGGLIDSTESIQEDGVLGLSRLPLVGPLFRTRTMAASKQELIVLLTPRIINRSGLPAPRPGVAPQGPSGVPNSGPMPGPSLMAETVSELPMMAPPVFDPASIMKRTPRESLASGSGLKDLLFTDFAATGASSATEMLNASRMPGPLDSPSSPQAEFSASVPSGGQGAPIAPGASAPGFIPARAPAPSADPGVRTTSLDEPRPAFWQEPQSPSEGDERGYRPGDLTRAVVSRLSRRFHKGSQDQETAGGAPLGSMRGAVQPSLSPSLAASAPRRDPAAARVGMAQHVVAPGEDFRSIADRYYGSPSLHAALWAVNRHVSPSPETLSAGTTLLLPPAEVLERVTMDAVQQTVRAQSPEPSRPVSPPPTLTRKSRFGFFER